MVLHTIVSEYDIFYRPEERSRCYQRQGEAVFEGENAGDGLKIGRIISTNLQDYLRYEPGGFLRQDGAKPASHHKFIGD